MQGDKIENAIIVKSKTRLEQLTAQFNTKAQAKFYISQNIMQYNVGKLEAQPENELMENELDELVPNVQQEATNIEQVAQTNAPKIKKKRSIAGQMSQQNTLLPSGDFEDYEREHANYLSVLENVRKSLSSYLNIKLLEREFLPSYIFTEKDMVIVVGQDGLVANTAKYVGDIPIVAINPDPGRFDGKLLPFTEKDAVHAVTSVLRGSFNFTDVTLARVRLLDGQTLLAFNDIFIGINTHASARYKITFNGETEIHSSSGIIVSTGAGSTGWLSSLYNMAKGINRFVSGSELIETEQLAKDAPSLVFIVREPFLSKTSQAGIPCGTIAPAMELVIESQMPQDGIIFSDGIFSDFLNFNSGAIATVTVAPNKARLVQK